jgi:hypothetical protein
MSVGHKLLLVALLSLTAQNPFVLLVPLLGE